VPCNYIRKAASVLRLPLSQVLKEGAWPGWGRVRRPG